MRPLLPPLACLLLALAATPATAGAGVAGTSSLRFDPDVLGHLGLALVDVESSAAPLREGGLGFRVAAGSSFALAAPGGDVEDFDAVDLRHAGGFALVGPGGALSFPGVTLAAAEPPYELALRDGAGAVWLLTTAMHAELAADGRTLSLRHADLVIAPALAARLGRPELADSYVGDFDAALVLAAPADAAPSGQAPASAAAAGSCTPDFSLPVDVALIELGSMTMAAREAGGRVAMAPRAVLRNVGQGDVPWNEAIAPDTPVGPHPFLALAFYRLAGGVLEQIGVADVKHAFFATNENCSCAGGHVLFVGCEDTYGVGTNLDRYNLGPRAELHAFARDWTSLGSHFDGMPVDDQRDHGAGGHDAFEHRLVVQEADLQTPGARYFYDAWYMAAGDVDLANSMGYREVEPELGGSTWAFPTVDTGFRDGPVLDVLADPQGPPAGAANQLVDSGDGRLQLVVTTADAGGGTTHYEYALMNFDFDRRVRSFRVPVGLGRTLTGLGFSDGDADAANDWTPQVGTAAVTWTAPPGAALDWGRLVGFRFDADAAPVASEARLGPQEPGAVDPVTIATLAPSGAAVPAIGWGGAAVAALALVAVAWRRSRARGWPAGRP